MKKLIVLVLAFICLLGLTGCNSAAVVETGRSEVISANYGNIIALAKTEFSEIFREFENIQIDQTSTLTRTDDAKQIIVQIKYSSSEGGGVYGFEYSLDDYAAPELIRHGEDVGIDDLLE